MWLHNGLKYVVIKFADKTSKFSIRRKFSHNVKAAVVSDNQVIWQKIKQVWNLRETLTFHNDESANHSVIAVTCTTCFGIVFGNTAQIQIHEQFIVEISLWLRCEKTDVFNNFLAIDKNHSPLSGIFTTTLYQIRVVFSIYKL